MPELAVKTKTKAKTRYLKAKRARRKNRRDDGAAPPGPQEPHGTEDEDEGDENENEDKDDEDEDDESSAPQIIALSSVTPEKPRKSRKRQKVFSDADYQDEAMPQQENDQHEGEAMDVDDEKSRTHRSPGPELPSLPSFPAPVQLNGPSHLDLALQGIDPALMDAELVDPSTVHPLDVEDRLLDHRTARRLADLGITELFAVQTALLPFLLPTESQFQLYRPFDLPRDVCVSAPTGSGKTLAYVLPIVELLSSKVVTRLRALVVLPTRDLVNQVRETFEALSKGRGLKVGTATGQHSFAHEQAQLVDQTSERVRGGASKVDILLCTPGRLIDHLTGTPNFTLQHLRFLVIDEADRLLSQSFQDWLAQVLVAIRPPKDSAMSLSSSGETDGPLTHDAFAPAWLSLKSGPSSFSSDLDEKKLSSCQKLLFSATLTRDPSKIAALDLHDPKYFIVQDSQVSGNIVSTIVAESFAMPSGLSEHMLVCDTSKKPLFLFYLVHSRSVTNALVFTKSAEATTRLVRLFEFFEAAFHLARSDERKVTVCAYSSDLPVAERKTILDKFRSQDIDILVCSDLISRGIDIRHVSHVVNYDVPLDMRKYVHRAGRTARAGRSGDAWSLVEEQEARYFKNMLSGAKHLDQVKRLRVSSKDTEALEPHYQVALLKLKEVYSRS